MFEYCCDAVFGVLIVVVTCMVCVFDIYDVYADHCRASGAVYNVTLRCYVCNVACCCVLCLLWLFIHALSL